MREVAEAIWYPLWDRGVALDHSVRDTVQMREAALQDHRAATGMLDARTVAGDAGLVLALRSEVLTDWRRDARRRLAEVREAREARIERSGWLAHSAVPDLKESGGGLRDGVMMRALVATWLVDVPHGESEGSAVGAARRPRRAARGVRPPAREARRRPHVDVARFLGREPEEVELSTRNIGRRLAHLAALAWRRVDDVLESRPTTITTTGPAITPLAEGVGRLDDEVIVMRDADPRDDPEVALRAAAAAARAELPLGSSTATHLAETLGDLPEPWPASATRTMVDLLDVRPGPGAGVGRARLRRRGRPLAARVGRHPPARLVVAGAPLHRRPAQHRDLRQGRRAGPRTSTAPTCSPWVPCCTTSARAGPATTARWATPWPSTSPALGVRRRRRRGPIGRLVRWHLLLPNIATRRDIEDPSTAANVAEIVETAAFLDLLAALTQADARATGPSAWSSWRRGLVEGLVAKVHEVLAGGAADSARSRTRAGRRRCRCPRSARSAPTTSSSRSRTTGVDRC